MSTLVVENKLFEMIMSLALPSQTLQSLSRRLDAASWTATNVNDSTRERILMECCGGWSDDPRSTAEILAESRSALGGSVIREIKLQEE